MKLRTITIVTAVLLAGSLSAQTLTEVINEFNEGVASVNSQEYESSVEHFNRVLALAGAVGDSASDLKSKAEEQIPLAYYRQATMHMKQKQYEKAIPYLEKTVEAATLYDNNQEYKEKSLQYLSPIYVMSGNQAWKNDNYAEAHTYFDKALELNEGLYKAHQGKGLVYLDEGKVEPMLEEFNKAKAKATAENDMETVNEINKVIDDHFNKLIKAEMDMVDPEDNDYTYVIEACENALAANPNNPRALYHLAMVHNKMIEYDAAIEYALKAMENETDPVWLSAINFELGHAYQNIVEYEKACEVLQKVMEEPFLSRAEKKMSTIPGCN
ncbi:MAG TPA: tetratricopeptide repeat protein [Bacteroides sp.]|nr:tetratricopeptide repeat protein [Bacteroides sp.]